jgi:hypothetical protein
MAEGLINLTRLDDPEDLARGPCQEPVQDAQYPGGLLNPGRMPAPSNAAAMSSSAMSDH